MIECTESFIYYTEKKDKARRKPKKRFKRAFILLIIILLGLLLFYQINFASFGLVCGICAGESKKTALKSITLAINDTLTERIKYTDLISVEKDNDGNISLLSADSYAVNSLCRTIAINTENILSAELEKGFDVPLFAFTGLKFFSGVGRKIKYHAIALDSVNCEFISKFTSVGINQTLHSLYIKVVCEVDIEFLHKSKAVSVDSEILISESVLVGKVPEVYLNGKRV